ncbi:hypothetical protein [Dyella sp. 2HG41-7]|uniref:hypothetical protein n=1 Tax=Dyella sp. 2HG41-7 TaxID=2883239 RepID=UPI001F321B2F|nr:hypothetical protein [Dyella sp. 2HG41-7]
MAKLSIAIRAFQKSMAHWGAIEYLLLLAVWAGLSTPFYLHGWGVLSALSLPIFLAVIIGLTYVASRFMGRSAIPEPALKNRSAIRRFPANDSMGIESYFADVDTGKYSGLLQFELNLIKRESAEALTGTFSSHPIIRLLDGFVLDDPETSNHHVLLCHHPFEGQVLSLSHDGDSRVVFSSLSELLVAAKETQARQISLSELHPDVSPCASDQGALSHLIDSLIEGTAEDADVALALIPSMDLSDTKLLEKLATHENFFFGEAVAIEIAKRPSTKLRSIALICSNHSHVQAAEAGEKALGMITD